MKKIILLITIFSFMTANLFAAPVTLITPPSVPPTGVAAIDGSLATYVESLMNQGITFINDNWKDQESFAHGLSNANAYSSHSADLNGYQGYDLFAISVGGIVGVQAPGFPPEGDEMDKIEKDHDIYAGVGLGASLNLGLNLGLFGVKVFGNDLYGNLKFGSYSRNQDFGDFAFEFESTTFGVEFNTQLLNHWDFDLILSILKWRGISVGTGFLYKYNKIAFTMEGFNGLEPVKIDENYKVALTSDFTIGTETTTYTVPFHILTSVRLLSLINISAGAGFDLNYGSTDIIIRADNAKIQVLKNDAPIADATDGVAKIDASTNGVGPSFFSPKLMAGVGLGIGPVAINVSLQYYLSSGASAGLSATVVW
jgi:hypothetical protein